jgi:hypothetical protein
MKRFRKDRFGSLYRPEVHVRKGNWKEKHMKRLSLIPTHSRRTILVAVVVAFTVSTNVGISKSAGHAEGRRGTPPPLDPPRDPGPIPTVGGGTVTIEPGPTIIVTRRGVVNAGANAAADTSGSRRKTTSLPGFTPTPVTSVPPTVAVSESSDSSKILAGRGPTPTLEPPRDPGPIPTVGGGTVTIEPGPTIEATRRGAASTPAAPDR